MGIKSIYYHGVSQSASTDFYDNLCSTMSHSFVFPQSLITQMYPAQKVSLLLENTLEKK